MRQTQKQIQKEIVYFEDKSYELIKQHFSLFQTPFEVNFHALKSGLWVLSHKSQVQSEDFFDKVVKLAEFMSEFVISFHNLNFEIKYDFAEKRNKWFSVNAGFVFSRAFNHYSAFYYAMAPSPAKLFAIDRYITLLYHQYKMYSLLDADQFQVQIKECLSGLSNFLAVESELKGMGYALQSHVYQSSLTLSYHESRFFPVLTKGPIKSQLEILVGHEKQLVQARRFDEALSVAKEIDDLLVKHAPQHDLPALNC